MKTADKKNIFEICERLDLDGKKPTLALVRKELGGGSFSTIQPILLEWKQQRNAMPQLKISEVPSEVKSVFERACLEVWATSKENADDELSKIKSAHEATLKDISQEKEELVKEVERLESELTKSTSELEKTKSLAKSAEKESLRLSKIENECITLKEKFEDKLVAMGHLQGELATLKELTKEKK